LRAVFRLTLLIGSVIRLLGFDLAVPDHSTLNRRAKTLQVGVRADRTLITSCSGYRLYSAVRK
jgi:hypothetical protein